MMEETKIRISRVGQSTSILPDSKPERGDAVANETMITVRPVTGLKPENEKKKTESEKTTDSDAPVFLSDEVMKERDGLKDLARQEFLFEKEIENIEKTGSPLKDLEKKNYKSLVKRKPKDEQQSKRHWIRSVLVFFGATVVMVALFVGIGYLRLLQLKNHEGDVYSALTDDQRQAIESSDTEGFVLGEEIVQTEFPVSSSSEHFKAQEVNIGGGLATLSIGENAPLQVFDIRSEPFTAKQGDEVKILISWRTNKLAASDIEYSVNGGQTPRKLSEENYSFSHSVLLSKLQPKTSYVYVITSKDRWGNKINSDRYGVYTASKPESVIDLIVGALEETFGWAVGK